jgi:hypothetical protein
MIHEKPARPAPAALKQAMVAKSFFLLLDLSRE